MSSPSSVAIDHEEGKQKVVEDDDHDGVADDVETSGLEVKRALIARDRAKGIGTNTNDEEAIRQARALAIATRGVRVDDEVDGEFGVLIPGTSFAAEARESMTKAARRFAEDAQRVAQRTRLQTPIAAPTEGNEDDEEASKTPVYITDDTNTKFEVRTYNDVTSKYINLDYYAKRVAPRTKHVDGTINEEAVRTATWVFAEEYARRDGFEGEESSSEEEPEEKEEKEEEREQEEPPAQTVAPSHEEEERREQSWCCGGSSRMSKATPPPEIQAIQHSIISDKPEVAVDEEQITREELKRVSRSLAKLELNIQQCWADIKRLARHLENNFTDEMVNVDPRAVEMKEILRDSEERIQQMLDERFALTAKETQLRNDLVAFKGGVMVAPNPVIASKDEISLQNKHPVDVNAEAESKNQAEDGQHSEKLDVYDPFEKIGRHYPSGLAAMFYFLAPMYLWNYYEWLTVERTFKRSVKLQTTAKAVFFYNPLLVAGARRLRLTLSVAEQFAMLLAVQSLLSFQLFIIDQKASARAPYITLYMFVLLATFNKVATPACVATEKSLKRIKKRGQNSTASTLWMKETVKTIPALTQKAPTTESVANLENEPSALSSIVESSLGDIVVQESLSNQDVHRDNNTVQATFFGEKTLLLEDRESQVAKMIGTEKKEAIRMLIVDEFHAQEDSIMASHIDSFSESSVDTLSIHGSHLEGSRFDGDRALKVAKGLEGLKPRSEQGDSGEEDIPDIDEEGYERLRRDYVAKAREERREVNSHSQKPIFDVSEYIPTVFKRVDSNDTQTIVSGSVDEDALKSTLNIEDVDSVFQAVHGTNARHKQKYDGGRGHWPNNVSVRELDKSKIALRLEEDEEETWDAMAILDNSREPIS